MRSRAAKFVEIDVGVDELGLGHQPVRIVQLAWSKSNVFNRTPGREEKLQKQGGTALRRHLPCPADRRLVLFFSNHT